LVVSSSNLGGVSHCDVSESEKGHVQSSGKSVAGEAEMVREQHLMGRIQSRLRTGWCVIVYRFCSLWLWNICKHIRISFCCVTFF
jgi:hypothetical protein